MLVLQIGNAKNKAERDDLVALEGEVDNLSDVVQQIVTFPDIAALTALLDEIIGEQALKVSVSGDTMTGPLVVSGGGDKSVSIGIDGNIEIVANSGSGPYIDFKYLAGTDFDARISLEGGGTGPENSTFVFTAKAVRANALDLGTTGAPGIEFLPTGNPIDSLGSIVAQKNSGAADTREIVASFGINASTGAGSSDPNNGTGDKIALYAGAYGVDGGYNIFAANFLTTVALGAGSIMGAWVTEFDFNNQRSHEGETAGPDGLAQPLFRALDVAHFGAYRSSAAMTIGGYDDGGWNRGIAVTKVFQTAFADYSNSLRSVEIYGNHTDLINAESATFTGSILKTINVDINADGVASFIGVVGNRNSDGYAANFANTANTAGAKGLKILTTWAGAESRALEVFIGVNESLRVSAADASNPVSVRVDGALKKVTVDGAGFLKAV